MASLFTNQVRVSAVSASGVAYTLATGDFNRVVFNTAPVALTNQLVTVTYTATTPVTAAGVPSLSGTGTLLIDRAHNNTVISLIANNRASVNARFLSANSTITLSANPAGSWGPHERRLRLLGYI